MLSNDRWRETTARAGVVSDDPLVQALDREAIRNLAALYSILRDDDDLDPLVRCFAPGGSFEISGRVVAGHEDLRAFYLDNMKRYRTSLHTTHSHLVTTGGSTAEGLVAGHAELAFEGTLMLAAYRYDDRYVVHDGYWTFASRRLRFMYTVPADQLATSFADEHRIRWPGTDPVRAELPETLESFTRTRDSWDD